MTTMKINLTGKDDNPNRIANALLTNGVLGEDFFDDLDEAKVFIKENFESFEGWKRLGFSVKKGEHKLARCLLWVPVDGDKDDKTDRKFKQYYANIFSRDQVEDTETAKARYAAEKAKKAEQPKTEKAEADQPKTEAPKKAPKAKMTREEATKCRIKALQDNIKSTQKMIDMFPCSGENSYLEYTIREDKKMIAKLEESLKNTRKAEKAEAPKQAEPKTEAPKATAPQIKKPDWHPEGVQTVKFERKSKKNARKSVKKQAVKADQPKTAPKAETVKAEAPKTAPKKAKAPKTAKKQLAKKAEAPKKAEAMKHENPVKMSGFVRDGVNFIKIENYENGKCVRWVEVPQNIYTKMSKTNKKTFERLWGIA